MSEKTLKEWYDEVNLDNVQPNGKIEINPVAISSGGDIEPVVSNIPGEDQCEDPIRKVSPEEQGLLEKERERNSRLIFLNERIKHALTQMDKIVNPFTDGSINRQVITDEVKYLLNRMIDIIEE